MKYKAFLIRALTNMHVGKGDEGFGVVDKIVQRDNVTNYPAIYSSSLKGALREFFNSNDSIKEDFIQDVFGGEEKDKSSKPGDYRFFAAHLLAIPVRSNKKPYYMATTPCILKDFLNTLEIFGIDKTGLSTIEELSNIEPDEKNALISDNDATKIEDWESKQDNKVKNKIELIGSNVAIFSEENFKELTKHLPVIARNHLENGKSTNLWYEEFVPRESIFYFIVGQGQEHVSDFEDILLSNIVQIGANASIGYGYTKISKIGGDK